MNVCREAQWPSIFNTYKSLYIHKWTIATVIEVNYNKVQLLKVGLISSL